MKPAALLESVLFAAGEPVPLSELAGLLQLPKAELRQVLRELQDGYAERGIRLVMDERTVQLVTAPEAADTLAKFRQAELRGPLSNSALETLAVVAYQGPATRPQVESIRGVHCGAAIRTLTIRGLITEVGRTKEPGRPFLYDVTLELYKHLGIAGRDELPQLSDELREKLQTTLETAATA